MKKGLGMWIMSKMVMFIFLFSLVAMLGGYYMIYQDKVIDDTAKKVTQSISETITDALSYKKATRTIWLDSNIWIRDTSRPYTIYLQYVENVGENLNRITVFLAWNDHKKPPDSFASASAVNLVPSSDQEKTSYVINSVCLYEIDSEGDIYSPDNPYALLVRPSAVDPEERVDYLLVYKTNDKLCIASKNSQADLGDSLDKLKLECENECQGY